MVHPTIKQNQALHGTTYDQVLIFLLSFCEYLAS